MICQPNNWNMLEKLEELSAQATYYYRPWAEGTTGILNTSKTSYCLVNRDPTVLPALVQLPPSSAMLTTYL